MSSETESLSSAKLLPNHELDTNLLFEKHTIEEIRDIEKRTRADIERKKEDLRVMVGERYRELIDAADTVTDMKNTAQNVLSSISHMQQLCSSIKQTYMIKGISAGQRLPSDMRNRNTEEQQFYGVASQIKLLLDVPEKIWSAVEAGDYLTGARLYLLARHVNTSLHLDTKHKTTMLAHFPVLSRQWTAISHFKPTILQACRQLLRKAETQDKAIAEALCSIMLLDDCTPRQVFNEFLLARTTAVQQLFHPTQHNSSIKDQVCILVQLIFTTVQQIYTVFYANTEATSDNVQDYNLLKTILTEITTSTCKEAGLIDSYGAISVRFLPRIVTDFKPSLKALDLEVPVQYLRDNCQQWIETCIQDVKSGVGKFLAFVNTVKRLADIRDAVWQDLAQGEKMQRWSVSCEKVLQKSLCIWQTFLRSLFLSRIQDLVHYQCDSAAELTKRHISRMSTDITDISNGCMHVERDISEFIWSESTGDIPVSTAWLQASARGLNDGGGLRMKTKAFTPTVQSICSGLDDKFSALQDDIKHYLSDGWESTPPPGRSQDDVGPFSRFADDGTISEDMQSAAKSVITVILDYVKDQLFIWETEMRESESINKTLICNKVLLAGRVCVACCDLLPHVKQCIVISTDRGATQRQLIHSISGSSLRQPAEHPAWSTVKQLFIKTSTLAYDLWSDEVSRSLLAQFGSSLLGQSARSVITAATKWDETDIKEETEDGRALKSQIRVPMQASWYLQDLLYALCKEINRIGGHSLNKSGLERIVYSVSDGVLGYIDDFLKDSKVTKSEDSYLPFTQQRALQLLFDIKFLLGIVPRKDDSQESKAYIKHGQKLIEVLEEHVDPFDLDVFSPYMQSHLTKQAHRASILLGALTSLDRHGSIYASSRAPSAGQQEQHNVLPLTTCSSRFALLPLSVQPSRLSYASTIMSQPKAKVIDRSGPSLTAVAASVIPLPHTQIHSQPATEPSTSTATTSSTSSTSAFYKSWFS